MVAPPYKRYQAPKTVAATLLQQHCGVTATLWHQHSVQYKARYCCSHRIGLLERIPVMETKSATSGTVENGEILEGQREEQRKL